MKKYTLILVCLILTCGNTDLSLAQGVLKANRLPNYPITDNFFNGGPAYAALDRDRYIYGSSGERGSGSYAVQLYGYDRRTENSELLFEVVYPSADFPYSDSKLQLLTVGGNVFAVVNGRLVVSNGTKTGTRLLANFGVLFCCSGTGTYRPRVRLHSSTRGIVYFEVIEDIGGSEFTNQATRIRLWRSDGSKRGTYAISPSHNASITGAYVSSPSSFIAKVNGENTPFYFVAEFGVNALWKVTEIGQSELVYRFPSSVDFSGDKTIEVPTKFTRTRNGTYFCTGDNHFSGLGSAGRLWRVSNSGRLTAVANGCWSDSTFNIGDDIYYTNQQGVWVTSGASGGERKIYSGRVRNFSNCVIDRKAYAIVELDIDGLIERPKLLEIGQRQATDISNTWPRIGLASSARITSCSNQGYALKSIQNSVADISFFSGFFNVFSERAQTVRGISSDSSWGPYPVKDAASSTDGILVNGDLYPYILRDSYAHLPSILDVLLSKNVE